MKMMTTQVKTYDRRAMNTASKTPMLGVLLLCIQIVLSLTPVFVNTFSKGIWMVISLCWYVTLLKREKGTKMMVPTFYLMLALWFTYEVTLYFIGYSSASIGNYFLLFSFFDILIKALHVKKTYDDRAKKILFAAIQLTVVYNLLYNIYLGVTQPNIHYYAGYFPEQYLDMNIAAAPFYNVLVFIIGINFYLFCSASKNKMRNRLAYLGIIVLAYYFMLSFETRTTSLIMSVLLMAVLFVKMGGKHAKAVRLLIVVVAAILLVFAFLPLIIEVLPERVSIRLSAIMNMTTSMDDNYLSRFRLASNSINTMIASPINFIFGIGNHLGEEYSNLIGQHSLVFDYMAKYGCIGLIFLVYFFRRLYTKMKEDMDPRMVNTLFQSVFLIFAIMSFLTNSFAIGNAVVVFLLPATLTRKNENSQNTSEGNETR